MKVSLSKAIDIMSKTMNYRGCRFRLNDDEVYTVEDQAWTTQGLMVWFQKDDETKWVLVTDIDDFLDQPK